MLTVTDEYSRFPFAFLCRNMESGTVIRCLTELFTTFGLPSYIHSDNAKSFNSQEFANYLNSRGVSTSYTSVYNLRGNGQCERYNAVIWTAVKLAQKTKKLPIEQWEAVLPEALHSIRSLLCTATNTTPHERVFNYNRRSSLGSSLPTWLSMPVNVLLKRHLRSSKNEPLVDEVELVHATPNYARVRLPSGRETTVSMRDVAPCGSRLDADPLLSDLSEPPHNHTDISKDQPPAAPPPEPVPLSDNASDAVTRSHENVNNSNDNLRRSSRVRRAPDRLTYYHD